MLSGYKQVSSISNFFFRQIWYMKIPVCRKDKLEDICFAQEFLWITDPVALKCNTMETNHSIIHLAAPGPFCLQQFSKIFYALLICQQKHSDFSEDEVAFLHWVSVLRHGTGYQHELSQEVWARLQYDSSHFIDEQTRTQGILSNSPKIIPSRVWRTGIPRWYPWGIGSRIPEDIKTQGCSSPW